MSFRSTFDTHAPKLAKNGYSPVPIKAGTKKPPIRKWQEYRYTDGDRFPGAGVGILMGKVIAVDIDVRDPALAKRLRNLAIEHLGEAPERIGAAPKTALLYRVAGEPFAKLHTGDYELPDDEPGAKGHKVEILADGQQIVCYHIHPETEKPYRWNGAGEPLTVPVRKLPCVTRQQCEAFVKQCEKLLAKAGTPCGGELKSSDGDSDPRIEKEAGGELRASDPELLSKALGFIPNADVSWDDWIKVCLAIKGALGDAGHDDWMQWSALSSKHDDAASEKAWRTAKPDRIGAGTIFHWAKQHGFKFPIGELSRNTEGGLAALFADRYGEDVRYDNEEEDWYVWNGTLWVKQPPRAPDVQERMKKTIDWISAEANEATDDQRRKALRQWAARCDRKSVIRGAMDIASSVPRLRITMAELDRDPCLLGTQSGVIDLRTGKLLKGERGQLISRSVASVFNPKATCPRWKQFISEVMKDDKEMIAFMRRFAGYLLLGGNPERLIFFLYGVGRNGKSVFIETLLNLMGDYGGPAKSELLMKHRLDRDSESAQPFMLQLRGLRYITASEVAEGRELDAAVVKNLAGGDQITVRGLHAAPVKFTVEGKFVVRCNHRPIIDGGDQAIWDRIVEIPFDLRLEESKQDRTLHSTLLGELPGILNWAISGCIEYRERGLQIPDKVRTQVKAYRDAMDTVSQWMKERTAEDSEARTSSGLLFGDYERWCAMASKPGAPVFAVSQREFNQKLVERGYIKKLRRGISVWRGIKLMEEPL